MRELLPDVLGVFGTKSHRTLLVVRCVVGLMMRPRMSIDDARREAVWPLHRYKDAGGSLCDGLQLLDSATLGAVVVTSKVHHLIYRFP